MAPLYKSPTYPPEYDTSTEIVFLNAKLTPKGTAIVVLGGSEPQNGLQAKQNITF